MIYYKMLETFMIILFSFQRKEQMRGKQIFLHWLVASISRF